MKSFIELKDMRFFVHHGVFEQETIVGNQFVVNLRLEIDLSKACRSDDVNDTVNYATVYELVKKEMETPSRLIEHVAYRILQRLKKSFPEITTIEVRLAKKHPPVCGEVDSTEVVLIDTISS